VELEVGFLPTDFPNLFEVLAPSVLGLLLFEDPTGFAVEEILCGIIAKGSAIFRGDESSPSMDLIARKTDQSFISTLLIPTWEV
jgi:hypothetical protein